MHLLRDDIGIDEDAGADNASHDDHGGVEQSDLAKQAGWRRLWYRVGGG